MGTRSGKPHYLGSGHGRQDLGTSLKIKYQLEAEDTEETMNFELT